MSKETTQADTPAPEANLRGHRDRLLPDSEDYRKGYEAGYADAYGDVSSLKDKLERLKAALRPFAFLNASLNFDRLDEDNIATVQVAGAGCGCVFFFVRNVFSARAALSTTEGSDNG